MQPQNWRSRNARSSSHEGYNRGENIPRSGRDAGNWEREPRGGPHNEDDYNMQDMEYRDRGSYHEQPGYGGYNAGYGQSLDQGRFQSGRYDDRSEHFRSPMNRDWRDTRYQGGGQYYQRNPGYQNYQPNQGRWSAEGQYGGQGSQWCSEDQSGRREFQGRGPKGYTRSDERIREEVCEMLSNGSLDASDIEVTVENGEVTLSGTVSDRRTKRMAEELLDNISGVKDCINNLKVRTASRAGSNGQKESAQKDMEAPHKTSTKSSESTKRTQA